MNERARVSRAVLVAMTMSLILLGAAWSAHAAERKLGTIGPPPRQDPQRMNSAESVPPLPLPATPLRRSEPKAEPAPPLFVGKLAYGKTQDYMPNPGDLDTLLRHVRAQIDAWYGWQVVNLGEIVAAHQAGKPSQVPMLYITGYEGFSFSDQEREALREYLLEGGTLLGDATLGSPAFAESFKRELTRMFPQRKLDVLQLDHPIMRGYYTYSTVNYFTVDKGVHTRLESPPQLLGMNIAARTAVILSPYDMTCGWDGFYAPPASAKVPGAPRTMAMMPRDATRMGINIVAYVAAQRRFAKAQADTRQIVGEQPQKRAALTLAHLRHHGDWNPDPNSLYQLIRLAAQQTSVPMDFELKPVDASIEQLAEHPVLIMTGMDEPRLGERQIDALRRHLQAGGFLFINNTSGFARFDREARELIRQVLPDQKLQPVPAEHELLSALYDVKQVRDATGQEKAPQLEAVFLDGRAVIVYSPNDTLAMLKGLHDPYANVYDSESARKVALNVLTYALRR